MNQSLIQHAFGIHLALPGWFQLSRWNGGVAIGAVVGDRCGVWCRVVVGFDCGGFWGVSRGVCGGKGGMQAARFGEDDYFGAGFGVDGTSNGARFWAEGGAVA
ncbi:hypothetical protein L1987_80312 [Smallanthus sonchifolius]|uniref:Uncharacterized protein n=1 Tax=Smallanthus sonchifolius TaxID=185202 RepID=A0ACB8YLP2_9ASTR|nr:hypothetical protein L1987_80312 [Smallanthus sonchifolius]